LTLAGLELDDELELLDDEEDDESGNPANPIIHTTTIVILPCRLCLQRFLILLKIPFNPFKSPSGINPALMLSM
jgi:hypothetical protein